MEILACTDSKNQLLSQSISREDAHLNGIWHRAVTVWIIVDRRVICQQRSASKDINPLKWDVGIAGHVDFGESTIDTALREAKEELNLTLETDQLQFQRIYTKQIQFGPYQDREFLYQYVAKLDKKQLQHLRIDPNETKAWKLIDIPNLETELSSQSFISRNTLEIQHVVQSIQDTL